MKDLRRGYAADEESTGTYEVGSDGGEGIARIYGIDGGLTSGCRTRFGGAGA